MLSSCVWSWFYFFRCCFTTTIFEERATVREHANVLFHVSRSFRSCFNCACGMKRTRDVLSITAECCKTEEKTILFGDISIRKVESKRKTQNLLTRFCWKQLNTHTPQHTYSYRSTFFRLLTSRSVLCYSRRQTAVWSTFLWTLSFIMLIAIRRVTGRLV